ncbi:MAG: FAD-dependent oxidoreductase [Proteobacteria bacterium]|nr:FAD-dependent oxidoreductase [Pseudomonadota bacterium]NDD03341.1 FAD-dependent oxidoreductase [Pseudomonadota bacterium]NDG25562.1 FAD-dependent oxidoreductase [Pseudomonadota bacterium]
MLRTESIRRLKTDSFDVLVIGGGATGAGIALDAAARGLKVALVEQNDFGSGTSSRSTKLVHGGVRYLEQAVLHLDRSQFRLVREALRERKILSEIAPHLVHWLPLLIPMYRRFEATYYNAGLRMYDWLAGKNLVHRSRFASPREALELCPFLKKSGLKGGVIYYDGQFDDARMNLSILLTAQEKGAVISNYVSVTDLINPKGQITGAKLRDKLSGEQWEISASIVINATGPLTDQLRKLDSPQSSPLLKVSSGAHLVLPLPTPQFAIGILIPKTHDKRVLFVLPWQGKMLVGTTDNPAEASPDPKATESDVSFILDEYSRYFDVTPNRNDILSTWSGLRPLAHENASDSTASLSRDHVIHESPSGLMSVFGGKWTTYRLMAEEAVDLISSRLSKSLAPCSTQKIKLHGAQHFKGNLQSQWEEQGVRSSTATHLKGTYGDKSKAILEIAKGAHGNLLHPDYPFIEAEVVYSARQEFVVHSADILFRRTRLAFLDKKAAEICYPRVQSLLAQELGWTDKEKEADFLHFKSQL